MEVEETQNPFSPFTSELDWKIGRWAVKDGPGHNAFDRLLQIPGVSPLYIWIVFLLMTYVIQVVEKLGLSFNNIGSLHQKPDSMPEKAGQWKTKHLSFPDWPDNIFTVRYRDPVEAIRSLWKDDELSPHIKVSPTKVFSGQDRKTRIFNEMWTAKWWHVIQVCYLFSILIVSC